MDIATYLANTLSHNGALREEATRQLELFAQENYESYALMLSQLLANDQANDATRQAAGLALKNSLTAKDYSRKEECSHRWSLVSENTRLQIKQLSLVSLTGPRQTVGKVAGQVVAAIADIELPLNLWPELIHILLENVTVANDSDLKQSTLQAIGYICEATDPDALASQSNQILTAIMQGARKEEPDQQVRLAAMRAMYNSLEFIKGNFEREVERNFIMEVMCDATQSGSSEVQATAFECLSRIMQLYYDYMRVYMESALFRLTISGMKHDEQNVQLQAIEFWSTVCDEELAMKEDDYEAQEAGEEPERVVHHFAERALSDILPVLLWLLTKQEEDEDEDEWTVSMAASTCLALLAQCVHNMIITPVVPFVESNIQSHDWRNREAAVMAFGSILEGPQVALLKPLVEQALPALINMMTDPSVNVKDTVAWTLGRVSETMIHCIQPETHLHGLVSALVIGLQDSPRIVSNCCWALMSLVEQLGPGLGDETPSCALSMYYEGITTALLQFTERCENEANCRTSAYEAIATFVMYSANDCISIVQNVALSILDRLDASVAMENQIVGADDRSDHTELVSSLLGVLTNCIRRLSRDISSVSDRIMAVILQLLSHPKQTTATEDAFLAVGALTSALENDFERYIEPFAPALCTALQNPAEYQLCFIAVGIIGDICRALGPNWAPYCPTIMNLLVENLQSPVLHRSVKPCILSCFGDVALAIGDKFEPFLDVVMMVLQQAGGMRAGSDNYDLIDYVNTLHEGNVEAYVGIVQGMNGGGKAAVLLPFVPAIFQFMSSLAADIHRSDSLTRALLGLMGDLAETFGGQLKPLFIAEWVSQVLRDTRVSRHCSQPTKETARWAKEMIKRACQ
ncbi:armadillo-type protein [Spinellus fusiger]|nr:armadillo-type protein [Spinellus fusiger]